MFGLIVRDYAYSVCFSVHSTQHTAHVVSFKIVYKNVRRAFFAELFNMTPVQIREGGSAISRMETATLKT